MAMPLMASATGGETKNALMPRNISGFTEDTSLYSASGEAFGAVKILEDSLPVVSEKGPDELSPWAHSSLRGKAFAAWTALDS